MINVGIAGGDDPLAGELIRVLVNHPDVVIRGISCPALDGHYITSVHHGLIGESPLRFSSALDISALDILFVTNPAGHYGQDVPSPAEAPELSVIDLYADIAEARGIDPLVVYGVPEISRKALVRGAKRAVIPPVQEVVTAIALYPLAQKSMLPRNLNVEITTEFPDSVKPVTPFLEKVLQPANNEKPLSLSYTALKGSVQRAIVMSAEISTPMPIHNIHELYAEIYDDHNMTFIVSDGMDEKEVVGTDKCIISITKSDNGYVKVKAYADAILRGGAGDGVHVMNLLMGLYEKTGLSLKANMF